MHKDGVAIGGYDVTAYFNEGAAVKGSAVRAWLLDACPRTHAPTRTEMRLFGQLSMRTPMHFSITLPDIHADTHVYTHVRTCPMTRVYVHIRRSVSQLRVPRRGHGGQGHRRRVCSDTQV